MGARALSNGINSAVFFCFFEMLRSSFAQRKEQVGDGRCFFWVPARQQGLSVARLILFYLPFDPPPLCRLTGALLHSWRQLKASLPPSCTLALGQPS